MKILVLIEKAWLGGHVLSAYTIACQLHEHNHDIIFAGDDGPLRSKIQEKFKFYQIPFYLNIDQRQTNFHFKTINTIKNVLKILKREKDIEIIHAFDERSYNVACVVHLLKRIPVTLTLCGGLAPYNYIASIANIMVFSQEQKYKLVNNFSWPEKSVHIVRNRINLDTISSSKPIDEVNGYNLNNNLKKIFLISRFDDTKVNTLHYVIEAFLHVLKKYRSVQLFIVGGGKYYKDILKKIEKINLEYSQKHIILTGPVVDAHRLLHHANIVLGVGRSAFEGLSLKKPTVLVGESGLAGTFSKDDIDDLGYYNFSGRNIKQKNKPEMLSSELIKILNDNNYTQELAEFGNSFIREEISVKKVHDKILNIYYNNISVRSKEALIFKFYFVLKMIILIWLGNLYTYLKEKSGFMSEN